jgi:hypothetical protein
MTMIACTINDRFPIIHSDILTTSTDRPETFYVPALTANLMDVLPEGAGYYPIGLQRKVTLLNDRTCFAFAGSVAEAKKLLEDLKTYCRIMGDISKDQLFQFLEEYGVSDDIDCFIVVMEDSGEGYVPQVIYCNNCQINDIPVFGKTLLLGSGGPDFLKAASDVVWSLSTTPTSPVEAVEMNMALVTGILSNERAYQKTLKNFWGAGMETIYWDGERFVRLEQTTFVFHHWFKNTLDDVNHPVPVKVTHYQYIDEMLLIVDLISPNWQVESAPDKYTFTLQDLSFGIFAVHGIDHKSAVDWAKAKKHLSFSSTFVGMGYIIIDGLHVSGPSGFHGIKDAFVEYQHPDILRIEVKRTVYDRIKSAFDNSQFNALND